MIPSTFGNSKAAITLCKILEKHDKTTNNKVSRYLSSTKQMCIEISHSSFSNSTVFQSLIQLYQADRFRILKEFNLPDEVYRFTKNVVTGYLRDLKNSITKTTSQNISHGKIKGIL